MYAIAGITGNTGKVAAETLLAQGKKVRAIVHRAEAGAAWQARGAEVAVAALEDTAALTRALAGVEAAYLLVPPRVTSPDPDTENRALIASLAAAVAAAKVPRVVLLSSIGAQHATGTGPIRWLHDAERALGAVTALTALRAGYFVENLAGLVGAIEQGVLPTFVPASLRFAQVSTPDIGRAAAAALVEGGRGVIELGGPRDLSTDDVAAVLTTITGKPVRPQEAPLDAVVPTLTQFGMSPASAALFREMYEGFHAGRIVREGGSARALRGSEPIETSLRRLLAK